MIQEKQKDATFGAEFLHEVLPSEFGCGCGDPINGFIRVRWPESKIDD